MKRNLLILLALVLVLGACKKTKSPTRSHALVKTHTQLLSSGATTTYTYTYDATSRVSAITSSDLTSTTFRYNFDSIIARHNNTGGIATDSIIYITNSDGLVDTAIVNAGSTATYQSFSYDRNGYPATFKQYNNYNELQNTYTYGTSAGNIVSTVVTDAMNTTLSTTNYVYDSSHLNSIGSTNIGQPYFGTPNVNTYKSATTVLSLLHTNIVTYTFSFDNFSQIYIEQTVDNSTGITTSTDTYLYY